MRFFAVALFIALNVTYTSALALLSICAGAPNNWVTAAMVGFIGTVFAILTMGKTR